MDRSALSHLAHAGHPIAAPLDDAAVEDLLRRALTGSPRVLDLGCGDGSWLLRALQLHPGATATGVDLSGHGFAGTTERARAAGVADRLRLVRGDARDHRSAEPYDAVLCVGVTHVFGGLEGTLAAAGAQLADDGVVLVGDGFWERPPTPRLLELLEAEPDEFDDLASTLQRIRALGWLPVHGHVSSQAEWDRYEWCWTGALAQWALDHPDSPDVEQVLAVADEHREQWLGGYRGTLGFVTLVLRRAQPAPAGRSPS